MSVASEITRLQNAKSALATSIGNKGVTVPVSTKLDEYPALVDQIQTGGDDDGVWHRPSNWPNYSKIPMSQIGTSEVYLTYDCRYAKAGLEPKAVSLKAYATDGYDVERGYIDNSGFVAVTQQHLTSSSEFFEYLPTNEGDFVVYRVTSENDMTNFLINSYKDYIGNQNLYNYSQPVLEIYGKLEYMNQLPAFSNDYLVSFSVVLKKMATLNKIFNNCYSLENVDTSLIDTSLVTNMANMFSYCYSLKHIDVSGFETKKVTTFNQMFFSCYSLEDIDVSGWDTSKLTNTYMMFRQCLNLSCEIDLSDWDMSLVTDTRSMFGGSYKIPKIHMPSKFPNASAAIFGSTRWCTVYIIDATIPPTAGANLFDNFNTSAKIYVPDESVEAYKTATNWSNWASYIYPISEYTE